MSGEQGPPPSVFSFVGRPDGLGNRLEEIIILNAISLKYDCRVTYLFNNLEARSDRRYKVLFKVANPRFLLAKLTRVKKLMMRFQARLSDQRSFTTKDLDRLRRLVSREEILKSARMIEPLFDMPDFPTESVHAFHVRASDRIDPNGGPHFLSSRKDLETNIQTALRHLKQLSCDATIVMSEEPDLVKQISAQITNPSTIPAARDNIGSPVPEEYRDLFAISRCSSVILAGAPSSFCLTAALIGNIPVHYVYLPEEFMERYPANYARAI